MKKFLFTLVALMSVGSALAINTIVIPDQELTTEQLGTTLRVDCPAQFDNYVSAWRLGFTSLPEGLTITRVAWGAASSTKITIYDMDGEEDQYRPEVLGSYPTWLVACMAEGYDEDGNYMGTPHWIGNLNDYLRITFAIDANFKGGTVEYYVEPSAGGGPGYPADQCCPSASHHDMSCTFTVPAGPVDPVVAPAPTIGKDDNGDIVATCEGHQTVLMLNGQEAENVVGQPYHPVNNSYTEELVLNFYAYTVAGAEEDENSAIVGPYTVTIPPKEKANVAAPQISYQTTDTQVIVTIVWPESDGQHVYTGQYTYDRPAYGQADQNYAVEAYITEGPTCNESAHANEVIPVPAQAPQWQDVAAPVITTTMDDENVYVNIEWPTSTGNHVYTGQLTYPRGDVDAQYDVEAYVEANYPYSESAHATTTIQVPAKPTTPPVFDETALAPNSGYAITGTETATITITNREPGATVYYALYAADENHQPVGDALQQGSFEGNEYSFSITGDGSYVVVAYAHIDGKNDSPDGGVFFTIAENEEPPVTGINELVNGKQIAGVRYFNMAGQEMQEVNGITIVVTTYTDGTTSTAKVMK